MDGRPEHELLAASAELSSDVRNNGVWYFTTNAPRQRHRPKSAAKAFSFFAVPGALCNKADTIRDGWYPELELATWRKSLQPEKQQV